MIVYKVKHHIPGRIRIEVPSLKKLSLMDLKSLLSVITLLPVPAGIKDVRPNLLTYSLVIEYDPKIINVIGYVEEIASNKDLMNTLGKE